MGRILNYVISIVSCVLFLDIGGNIEPFLEFGDKYIVSIALTDGRSKRCTLRPVIMMLSEILKIWNFLLCL